MSIRAKTVDSRASARQTNDTSLSELSAMRVLQTIALLLIIPTIVAAQTQTRERRSTDLPQTNRSDSDAVRNRVVASKAANHAEKAEPAAINSSDDQANLGTPAWGNSSVIVRPTQNDRSASTTTSAKPTSTEAIQPQPKKLVQPTLLISDANARAGAGTRPMPPSAKTASAPTSTYNVGIGDVLDVRLANWPTRESTLFTVMKDGTVEYPLVSGPVAVAGLTTDEIASLLSAQIKVITAPQIEVSVRDFASHAVVVSGLVDSPGRKTLRREAMPLYTVLAQALIRPEATIATIVHSGKEGEAIDLKNDQAMAKLVVAGDIIKVATSDSAAKQFLYVGGEVVSPGEKTFRDGLTLTQALLSAGGVPRTSKMTIKVSRRNGRGFLSTTEYNLRTIEEGKSEDPLLQAGDRIEVIRAM
jgi:protein involved in polysaccharide export with SLBB domain